MTGTDKFLLLRVPVVVTAKMGTDGRKDSTSRSMFDDPDAVCDGFAEVGVLCLVRKFQVDWLVKSQRGNRAETGFFF
jgi:hypothetical protein